MKTDSVPPTTVPAHAAPRAGAGAVAHCSVDTTLNVIGGKWKPVILYHLRSGPKRFNELRRLLPAITQRMLTAQLRQLEADAVIERKIFPVIPPHVEYKLSPVGASLMPILTAMAEWGAAHDART